MACSKRCQKFTALAFLLAGIVILVAGIVLQCTSAFRLAVEKKIKENVVLKPGLKSYDRWQEPNERWREYYIFNITDTNVTNGSLPKVQEIGPFVYRLIQTKNVTKLENGTITYFPNSQFILDPEKSCKECNPHNNEIIAINTPVLVLGHFVSRFGRKGRAEEAVQLLNQRNISLFQKRSVHEILWGYRDSKFAEVLFILTGFRKNDTISLQMNNSGSGEVGIYTGQKDVNRVAGIFEWRGERKLTFWNSDFANMINGTGGFRFHPLLDKKDVLNIFVPDLCRSIQLRYLSKDNIKGIDLYRFSVPDETFESGNINPNNKAFCVSEPKKACLPSGLEDVSLCHAPRIRKFAPPAVASASHFYQGEPSLSQAFDIHPDADKDETFIDVEPNTGFSMNFHKRLQLNMAIPSFSLLDLFQNKIKDPSNVTFFPLFYIDEWKTISDADADEFKNKILLPLHIAHAIPFVLIAIGAFCIILSSIFACLQMTRASSEERKALIE